MRPGNRGGSGARPGGRASSPAPIGKSGGEATNSRHYSAARLNAPFRGRPTPRTPQRASPAAAQRTRDPATAKSLAWPNGTLQVVVGLVLGRTWNPIGPGVAVGRKKAWSLRPSPS